MKLMDLLYPSNIYCISCGAMIDDSRSYSLCDDCIRKIHWITGINQRLCIKCGKILQDTYLANRCYNCLETDRYFHRGYSAMEYGLYERKLLMDIKYSGKGYIALKLGEALSDRLWPEVVSGALDADVIVPVPLSKERLKNRGYNQSELLAKEIVKRWKKEGKSVTLEKNLLYRSKVTQRLRSLSPEERALALEGAFKVRKEKVNIIANKCVLLIDDIYTTGATADACSKALLQGGASRVYFAALACGGNSRPSDIEKNALRI